MTKSPRISAKALIIHEQKLLLIRKFDHAGDYYIVPGGGQEHGESLTDALVREVLEETGLHIAAGEVVFMRDYIAANHEFAAVNAEFHQLEVYFTVKLLDEKLPAVLGGTIPDKGQTGLDWVPLNEIPNTRVYPLECRQQIASQKSSRIYCGDVN